MRIVWGQEENMETTDYNSLKYERDNAEDIVVGN